MNAPAPAAPVDLTLKQMVFRPLEWAQARVLAVGVVIAAFGLIALTEVASIVSDVHVGGTGYSPITFSSITHPNSAGAAYLAWAKTACAGDGHVPVKTWLLVFNTYDIVFIAGYTLALAAASRRWKLKIGRPLACLAAFDVLEDVIGLGATTYIKGTPNKAGVCMPDSFNSHGFVFGLLTVVTCLKWAAVLATVLAAGYRLWLTRAERAIPRRETWRAIGAQKFLLIMFVSLAALLLLHGAPILEQGVDVERSWFLTDQDGRGLWSALFGFGGFAVLAAMLRYLASVHVGGLAGGPKPLHALKNPVTGPLRIYGPWVFGAGIYFGAVEALDGLNWAQINSTTRWVVVGVLAGPVVLSFVLWVFGLSPADAGGLAAEVGVARRAWRVGRLLAYATFLLLPMSLSRAFVPTLLLDYGNEFQNSVLVVVPPFVTVVALFIVLSYSRQPSLTPGAGWSRLVHPQYVGAQPTQDGGVPGWLVSLLPSMVALVISLGPLVLMPVGTSTVLGVVGTVAVCMCGLAAVYSAAVISAQLRSKPALLFRVVRMRRTPVVALGVLLAVLSTFISKGAYLHDVRKPVAGTAIVTRDKLPDAFTHWKDAWSSGDCQSVDVSGPNGKTVHVRPMLFVAAEGGGIRAAVWTVDAMTRLTSSACGRKSVFVVSGVSGGATGLAVMNASATPLKAVDAMTHEDALAVGVDGLLSRDLIAGVLGANITPIGASPSDKYPDRGSLMEQAWERDVDGKSGGGSKFADPFPAVDGASWKTVFNSTSVANGCRVLVTDINLGSTAKSCTDPDNPVPGTYDLLGRHTCYQGLNLSTAQLLAARFPYVTPSGVIRGCDNEKADKGKFQDQLIDGGYSENSGIDTLNGLLQSVLPHVQAENEKQITDKVAQPVFVVPMVVFLHNTVSGPAPLAAKKTEKPEVLVPPTSASSGGILGETATLLQRSQALTAHIFPGGSKDSSGYRWLTHSKDSTGFSSRAMIVGPTITPQVALPLGWAMSQETIDSMSDALKSYLNCAPTKDPLNPCAQTVAFNGLLDRLGVKRCNAPDEKDATLAACPPKKR